MNKTRTREQEAQRRVGARNTDTDTRHNMKVQLWEPRRTHNGESEGKERRTHSLTPTLPCET
ncbi:hypothetical protein E2C01_072736 [Portunus trituberculatus]|uniref:Uncharacterized protein n=1 Tax=Portunus trituberculatus TaxID=210409 RepID=A0A5B7HYU3_PORTR|nr:hypothetical protein [Portunus trituberculatus]